MFSMTKGILLSRQESTRVFVFWKNATYFAHTSFDKKHLAGQYWGDFHFWRGGFMQRFYQIIFCLLLGVEGAFANSTKVKYPLYEGIDCAIGGGHRTGWRSWAITTSIALI